MGNKGEKLPNNTVFSKKILDFFLFLCVFGITLNRSAQGYTSADIACTNICEEEGCNIPYDLTGENIAAKCKNVKGCKYTNTCLYGDVNKYTDYTINGCDSSTNCNTNCCETSCPSDYPSSATGSWDANQCYKSVNLANDQATIKCRIYQSGTVMCATSNITQCQGTWGNSPIQDGDGFCDLNSAAVPNNQQATQNSTNLSAAHLENNSVYLNTRACNLFYYRKASEETSVSHSASGNPNVIITGTARWYTETNTSYWKVNECYKKENNENISGGYCIGVTIAQASNGDNDIHNVNDVLVYYDSPQLQNNNSNCPSCWQYRCTSCPAGYRPDSGTQGQYNSCPRSDNVVCSCAETVQGYYSTGGPFCNYTFDGSIFSTNNFVNNFCSPSSESYVHPCSKPGMTSDGGATSDDECHYGSGDAGTQFCDAFGCVWLDGLSFDSTNRTYSWTGHVHLVGVSNENADRDYSCPGGTPHFWGYDKDGNPINAQGDIVDNCRRN